MYSLTKPLLLPLVLSLLLVLAGCGTASGGAVSAPGNEDGGDDQGTAPIAELELLGPYGYFELSVDNGVERSEHGPAQVDATGLLNGEGSRYVPERGLSPPEPLSPTTTVLDPQTGDLATLRAGEPHRSGALDAGGDLALLAGPTDTVALQILLRPTPGLSGQDLAGRYHFIHFTPSRGSSSSWGQLNLDDLGGGVVLDLPAAKNVGGRQLASELESVSYVVRPDGALDLTTNFQGNARTVFEGRVGAQGDLFVAMRTDSEPVQEPTLFAAVRAGGNATVTTLRGRYRMVVFLNTGDETPRFMTINGTLVADGAGNATLEADFRRETQSGEINANTSYAVAPDGTLTLSTILGELKGGVDATGRFAVFGGASREGQPPTFGLLARQP